MKHFGVLLTMLIAAAHAADRDAGDLTGYDLAPPAEQLPDKPWHARLTDENAKTPEGAVNPCVRWTDLRLKKALAGKLQELWPKDTWQEAPQFLNWAVWGYLSSDSEHHRDERLIPMMREWIESQLGSVEKPPKDAKKRKEWRPRQLNFWSFHNASIPLLELLARPELAAGVGREPVERWKQLCIENVKRWGEPESWNALIGKAETYINIAAHPMAAFVHGWMLTGDRKYLWMAARIVGILARDQAPNGTFPYRCFGGDHLESETMYYHSMNVRALYIYWWYTGSKLAERTLKRAVPYYPLRMAPKYHFEDACAIWWKDQWRTFWPNHIAMIAAVGRDGENATIATEMARDNRSADRADLVLGAHAYQLMTLRGVREAPRRDRYIIADPDTGGLRGRFDHFDLNFSTNSYSHTLTGATVTTDDWKQFGALHRACPFVRVAPLEKAHRTSPNYWCLGKHSPGRQLIIEKDFAVAGATYAPFQPSSTWRPLHRSAPWKIAQLWLYTPTTMVGLMIDEPTLNMEAREVSHQFRFITLKDGELKAVSGGQYETGLMRLTVHSTNLGHALIERVRRYALNPKDRRDWQLALSDIDRSPEHVAQAKEAASDSLKLPDPHPYQAGTRHFSLVEIGPTNAASADSVQLRCGERVFHFTATLGTRTYVIGINFHDFKSDFDWEAPAGVERATLYRSWLPQSDMREEIDLARGKLQFEVREAGAFCLTSGR